MKQYLIGFISATMLTTSFFLFVGAKKRSIDNLTVQKITIVDESGNQVGEIGNKQLSSYFWLKSQRNNCNRIFLFLLPLVVGIVVLRTALNQFLMRSICNYPALTKKEYP